MHIQQIIPRNKSGRSNYYVDISKLSKLATGGESLVQPSDRQKDLRSLQDGQRQAFVLLLELGWVSRVHRLRAEVSDTVGELDGLGMKSQSCLPFEVNSYHIIRLR